jgi:hypothetical protein
MEGKTHIAARRALFSNKIELSMVIAEVNDAAKVRLSAAKHVEMSHVDEGAVVDPFMVMSLETAQLLMDELWNCGLRPSEGTGSAGSLAATERHLKDMKTIAFHALKIQA